MHAYSCHLRPAIRMLAMLLSLFACTCLAVARAAESAAEQSNTAASGPAAASVPARKIDFGRDIQPILAKRCFACHGPDQAESGLRLNKRETALAEADSGEHAIVPGRPDESELVRRISAEDEGERMPPEGKPLAPGQVDLIRQWIDEGAAWEDHWAFQPVVRPPAAPVQDAAWLSNPIDSFILSRLEASGLRPAARADKVALIRRAYYDVTGLPPTLAEVDAFLADTSPDAYEKVIDRLLASPHYGERWARHWLDVVRFAETNSFERDGVKPHAWRYRDYVIRSLNEDKPYDRFVREQLAGDELQPATIDGIIATGFYRLGLWDDEPADRLQAEYDTLDDLVTTTGQVFLGLTINCARCHDHKIDPIPQRDYYGMVAFFHGIKPMATTGPNIEVPLFAGDADRADYQRRVRELEQQREQTRAEMNTIEQAFRKRYRQAVAEPLERPDLEDLEYRFYRDHWEKLPDFDNIKPETVGQLPTGFFDTSLATRETDFGFVFTGYLRVPADDEYTFTVDSDDGVRLVVDGRTLIEYDGIHSVGEPRRTTVALKQGRWPVRLDYFQGVGEQGLSVSWAGPGFERRALALKGAANPDAAKKRRGIRELLHLHGEELLGPEQYARHRELRERLDRLNRQQVAADYALAVTENGPQPPDTFLLARGNAHVPGEKVEPAFPSVLSSSPPVVPSPVPGQPTAGRRKVLADWIASPDNRMTARVIVNRLWQHHFGRGIVRSPNNFGYLGDRPTHPELLDWLASELVGEGWRLKPLHRLIMLSSAYRMSSRGDAEALAKDPSNDLFWRFDMRRLSAEEIRDSIHAITGQLNPRMYGPGVYPELSEEVLATQSVPGQGWGKSSLDDQARRSVYIHVKRSLITPLMSDFDFPDTDSSCEARFVTTQPAQALGMINGTFIHRQAAEFARRLRREAGDSLREQVALAGRLALGRATDEAGLARGAALIERLRQEHQLDADRALEYYCLIVLNLNEFLYLD